ncbi:Rtf2 RING-finger-domain-containing protein [Tuber borchii]|uniref:Rtf2 RING-finger-domain-containing protein n=1 Tax=Tuber borchii TaxID=42251 RepID=A0A2T6ZZN8_TUBBO|nr:Rtf2 RING-finger-domain-containing protein [Tuber borchii]
MGNDGGSIPTRRELVKSPTKQKTHSQLRDTNAQTQTYHWTTCPLSKRPLSEPIVSDSAGVLYNKDSIIEWLLKGVEAFGDGEEVLEGRIHSLKDVVEVKFEEGRICPVSRKELGPGAKAVYLVPCGHAFSESSVKEVGEGVCLKCDESYTDDNIIPINPTALEDLQQLKARMEKLTEKGLTHALKSAGKTRKRKKDKTGAGKNGDTKAGGDAIDPAAPDALEATAGSAANGGGGGSGSKSNSTAGSIKSPLTAGLTNKVLEDERVKNKRRKVEMSDNLKSLFSKEEKSRLGKNDFMSRGYSIPGGK